jgi:hypothetical protein
MTTEMTNPKAIPKAMMSGAKAGRARWRVLRT